MRMLDGSARSMRITVPPNEEDARAHQFEQQRDTLQRVSNIEVENEKQASKQERHNTKMRRTVMKMETQMQYLSASLVRSSSAKHTKARGPNPGSNYPKRFQVKDDDVDWAVLVADYQPQLFTSKLVQESKNADPEDVRDVTTQMWEKRPSWMGVLRFGISGSPLNPQGRTGLVGRGAFYSWGPNKAIDPIVTRFDPDKPGQLQVLCKWRADDENWGLPGTMMQRGESEDQSLRRALQDVAKVLDHQQKELMEKFFHSAVTILQSYVDDPRNTDNAWIETTALHLHCGKADKLGEMLEFPLGLQHGPEPGSMDQKHAPSLHWINVDESRGSIFRGLHANHHDMIDLAVRTLRPRQGSAKQLA